VGWVARIDRWGGALGGRSADCGREGVRPIERKRGATMRVPSVGGTERIPSFASTTKLSEPDRDRARPPPEPYEVSPRAPRFFASTPATCTSSEKN